MSIWVIIPVKPLNRAKSRLASVLTPDARARLSEFMFRQVLMAVQPVQALAGVLVISRDQHALAIARDHGAHTLQEAGNPELNTALTRATQVVLLWRGSAVLILPADLPLITSEDVSAIVEMGKLPNTMVIATDAAQDGTNALLLRPPGVISFNYGTGSFEKHKAQALEAGMQVKLYQSDRIALDIDVPGDLDKARAHGAALEMVIVPPAGG